MTCCNTTEILSTSGDTNSLTANTVFWGPKVLPDTAVKILPLHRATLTPTRKLKMFSYLNIIWSVTLHSCFFWQSNTPIFQGSEDCGRHLLRRKQKVLLLNHVKQLPGRHLCMTERCSSGTHLHFGCCQSWIPGDKTQFPTNSLKEKSQRFFLSEKRQNNSHCHSPSVLKTGRKDAEPAVSLQLLLWVLIQDGPKKRAQSFVWTKREAASKDFSWDNGQRKAKSLEFQPGSQGSK